MEPRGKDGWEGLCFKPPKKRSWQKVEENLIRFYGKHLLCEYFDSVLVGKIFSAKIF